MFQLLFLLSVIPKGNYYRQARAMLKEVGRRARTDIENLLGSKIFLELWVKVKKIGAIRTAFCGIWASIKTFKLIPLFLVW